MINSIYNDSHSNAKKKDLKTSPADIKKKKPNKMLKQENTRQVKSIKISKIVFYITKPSLRSGIPVIVTCYASLAYNLTEYSICFLLDFHPIYNIQALVNIVIIIKSNQKWLDMLSK